MELVSYCC